MRVVLSLAIAGWLAAWGAVALAGEPEGSPRRAELAAWLADLDHEEFSRREAAAQKLRASGPLAIEVLAAGALAESPEVAWRSGEILKKIALDGDETTLQQVAAALAAAGNRGRPGMHGVIAEIRAKLQEVRRERAVAAIRRQGGQIASMSAEGAFGVGVDIDVGFLIAEPAFAAPLIIAEEELAIEVVEAAEVEVVESVEAETVLVEAAPAPPAIDLDAVVAKALRTVPKIDAEAKRAALEEMIDEKVIVIDDAVLLEVDGLFDGPAIAFDAFPRPGGEAGGTAMSLSLDANWRGGDAGLAAAADLPEIAVVSINRAKLGDQGLRQLARLPRLRSIRITGTPFSADALRALHRAKPDADMFCQGNAMLGIHADRGGDCTLTSVYPGSGAAEAGLQTGDKIVAIDGVEIRDFAELTISVYTREAGEKLKIAYVRDGKQRTATVVLKPRAVLEP